MKIISFSEGQSGEEWLNWRKNGIGASDISVIMGSNPYCTPRKLWNIKCGFESEPEINAAMAHGIRTEDIARQWINEHYQLNLKPVCLEDDEKSFFRASLDGFDFDQKVLVEIKCPISEKVLDQARLNQVIPDYWYDQVQWQIMMSNPLKAMIALWDFRHNCCICVDLFGNSTRIENMRTKGAHFWHHVQIGKAPEPQKGDYIEVEDDELHALLLEYHELTLKEKGYTERKKEVKKKIEDFGDDGDFTAYGFKIQRVQPAKKYDIDQMRADGVDVDAYLKKNDSIGWYRIIPPSKNN